jgi:hypothetical protein
MMRKTIGVMVMLACFAVGRADASTIFSDNFNSENGGSGDVLNYTGFANFTITDGTVDLIGHGGSFDFLPGNGMYVDLDGSTGDAGLMTENGLALGAGSYSLLFDLAGSHRGTTETVTATVFGSLNPNYGTQVYTPASGDPFSTRTISFTLGVSDAVKFKFQNAGSDNVGALLDNVQVTSAVPEPASILLLGTGLFGLGVRARRKLFGR